MNLFRTHITLSTLIFCTTLCGWAQSYMYVQLNVGDVILYRLEESPIVTYTDTELIVRAGSNINNLYPISNVKNLIYKSPTAILTEEDLSLQYPIRLFSTSGHYITTLEQEGDLKTLCIPFGVYIFRSQKTSQKVLLQ